MKADIVIDIETLVEPVTGEEIEKAMAEYAPPSNYKNPEVILKHRENYQANIVNEIREAKRFSLGGKRMVSCALGFVDHQAGKVTEIESWASDDLSVITRGVVNYLDSCSEYRLVGWNHKGFDLPELAKAFWKTGVKPQKKPAKWDVIDLCDHPFRKCKLKETAKAFGIPILGIDGGAVEKLHEEGNWGKIQEYNEDDVKITGLLFLAACNVFTF